MNWHYRGSFERTATPYYRKLAINSILKIRRIGHFAGWEVGSMSLWVILQAGKKVV